MILNYKILYHLRNIIRVNDIKLRILYNSRNVIRENDKEIKNWIIKK